MNNKIVMISKRCVLTLGIGIQVLVMPMSAVAQTQDEITPVLEKDADASQSAYAPIPEILKDTVYTTGKEGSLAPEITLTEGHANTSAQVRKQSVIRTLTKKNYRADESVHVLVFHPDEPDVTTAVFDPDGEKIAVKTKEIIKEDVVEVSIEPPASFRPGKYHLVVTDTTGQKSEQDFTWGVLAINPNKSVYAPNEKAGLAMAVLDETGMMVCDANVELRIMNQELGIDDLLSTQDGTIRVNPECMEHDFTTKPDYEADYQTGNPGTYDMTLTAKTKNGTASITDRFFVKTDAPLDVERVIATRIYPPKVYPVELKITAQEDFSGTVTEIVPADFVVSQNPTAQAFEEAKTISSSVDAKEDVLGIASMNLVKPVDAERTVSLNFAEQLKDPALRKTYAQFGLSGHDGVDFDVPVGTSVMSVDDGDIILAKENWDYGTSVVVQHSWGRSYYGHLSDVKVQFGDTVFKGQEIALSGDTGLTTGPHLHFGIKPNNQQPDNGYYGKVNPAPYIGLEEQGNVSYDVQVLRWNVTLKKGEATTLGYTFKTPNISPQFYLLGPLKFFNTEGDMVFQEERSWQLAIDAEVVIDNDISTSFTTHQFAGSKTVFTNDTDGYTFYTDSNGSCVYQKTADGGGSWGGAVTVDSQTDCIKVTVWYDQWTPGDNSGTLIHIITADTSVDDVWYRTLDTSGDTLSAGPTAISSSPGPVKPNSFDAAVTLPVITKGTDGEIYVGVHDNSSSDDSFIISCSSTCTTASNWGNVGTLPIDDGTASANDMLLLMPLAGGDILAIRHDDSADDVQSKVWNGSSWDVSWTDIDTTVPNHNSHDSTLRATVNRSTNDIYLAYIHDFNDFSTADHDIQTAIYNGSWTDTADAMTNSDDGTDTDFFITSLAMGMDENTGDVYVAYSGGPSVDDVFYKVSDDDMTTWSTRTKLNVSGDASFGLNMNLTSTERLYATWYMQTPDDLFGNTVADLVPAPSGPTLDQLMRHGAWFNASGVEQPFTF